MELPLLVINKLRVVIASEAIRGAGMAVCKSPSLHLGPQFLVPNTLFFFCSSHVQYSIGCWPVQTTSIALWRFTVS